MTKFLA